MWPVLPQLGVFVRRGYLTEHREVRSERKCTEVHENTSPMKTEMAKHEKC